MSDKRSRKNTTKNNKNNKEASKNRKALTLRLDNDATSKYQQKLHI